MRTTLQSTISPVIFTIVILACGELRAGAVYVALGDSSTFGNDESVPSSTMPNYGDQGFVRPFADFLRRLNGGVRPQVVNLAISGELSSSFLTGKAPSDWPYRRWNWNLNYPNATTSQNSLMLSALDAAHTAGNAVWVTLNFGGNDFGHLVASAAWQMATPAEQQAMFAQLLNQLALNYETVLTEVEMHAPGAHILLQGFFDNLVPSDPGYALNETAIAAGNQVVQQIATAFGSTYVDFYSVINGHVLELTNHDVPGGGHLNEAGYAAVAHALDLAAVPEPASLVMLGIGFIRVLGYGRLRMPAPNGRCHRMICRPRG
jgi:lysophospholipase L1-like esterase